MQKIFTVFIILFATFNVSTSMAEVAGVPVPAPVIDNSSPEMALRGYWAYMDWKGRVISQYIQSAVNSADAGLRNQLLGGERLALENWRDREYSQKFFQREVMKTVQLSDDSAEIVVHIRNVTPNEPAIDTGRMSKVNKLLFSQKASGRIFKYLLEKKGGDWKVMQVFAEKTIYSDKAGWEPAYVIPFAPTNTLALDP